MVNGEKRHNEVIRVIHSAANDEIEPEIVCRTRRTRTTTTTVNGERMEIMETD